MAWRDELRRLVAEGEVRFDEPMRHHTSFRIGGPAEALVVPASRRELRAAVEFAFERDLPWFILGRGTNLLVRDGGVRGLVIKTTRCLRSIAFTGLEVRVEAGFSLNELACEAAARSLSGLAFAAGIPGTVGGGIYMNAGAYGGEIGQMVLSVTAYHPGRGERSWLREELGFGYRTSRFQDERAIIEEARLRLVPGDAAAIRAEMEDYARRRQEKQPLNLPSAGSVFRRPPGSYAGALIEEAGLKGLRVGGAQISERHANFIVNLGGARAADVLALIELVRTRVKERTGVLIEPEVEVIGID